MTQTHNNELKGPMIADVAAYAQTIPQDDAEEMRQQVDAYVKLTYDADARLDVDQLSAAIHTDIEHLRTPTGHSPVDLMSYTVKHIAQEAEIYGNDRAPDYRDTMTQTYTAWRSAIDSFEYYTRTGSGDPVALAKAALDAERAFIQAHSFAQ